MFNAPFEESIRVVLAADDRYSMPLAVAIKSVATNCKSDRRLLFTVIQNGISQENRERIESSLFHPDRLPNVDIEWIEANIEALGDLKIAHHYMNPIIYSRLLIPGLLPKDVRKVLYLDSDIVATEDVSELWDTDMRQKSLLAVQDRIGVVSARGGLPNYLELGIAADAKYFNSGVLVMDLDRWRALGISQRVLDYTRTHRDIIQMGDQDGLNAVLFDDWGEVEFRWNWQIIPRNHRGSPQHCWVSDFGGKSIIHFVTSEKPWLPGCQYEEKRFFFDYLDKTEWAGWRVSPLKEMFFHTKKYIKRGLGVRSLSLRELLR